MSFLLDIVGSSLLGSIVGGVFSWLGKREERANMKMKFDHDVRMIEAKTTASIEIAKMGLETTKEQGKLAVEKVEAIAFQESQKSTGTFSDILKSLVRPIILGLLMYQTYKIIVTLEVFAGGLQNFESGEILDLYRIIILSVTSLTATAVGWWFAARPSKQFDKLIDKWH